MFGVLRDIWDKIVSFFANLFFEPEVVVDVDDENSSKDSVSDISGDSAPEVSGEAEMETLPSPEDVVVFIPRAYEDVRDLKKYMDMVKVIVLDLTELPDEYERTMFLDFVWGMVRAAGGHFKILEPVEKSYTIITSRRECDIDVRYGSSNPYEEDVEQTEEVAQ